MATALAQPIVADSPAERGAPTPAAALVLAREAAVVFASLLDRLHPSWVRAVGIDLAVTTPGHCAVWIEAITSRFDLRWPDLSAARSALELLWLLPPAEVQRVCIARALFACREPLARCVDGQVRRRARELVGAPAYEALAALPAPRGGGLPLPADVDSESLGLDGWQLLDQATEWRDSRARRLVQLMLPLSGVPSPKFKPSAAEHALFVLQLPHLFPEHAWLFGFNPARCISG